MSEESTVKYEIPGCPYCGSQIRHCEGGTEKQRKMKADLLEAVKLAEDIFKNGYNFSANEKSTAREQQFLALAQKAITQAEGVTTGPKVNDDRFEYTSERHPMGRDCACRIRIWQAEDQTSIVLMTQLEPSPGASVTNTVESIATEVVRQYGVDPERTVWVEHYEHAGMTLDGNDIDETFDLVDFEIWHMDKKLNGSSRLVAAGPKWKHWSKEEFEKTIGQPLARP